MSCVAEDKKYRVHGGKGTEQLVSVGEKEDLPSWQLGLVSASIDVPSGYRLPQVLEGL